MLQRMSGTVTEVRQDLNHLASCLNSAYTNLGDYGPEEQVVVEYNQDAYKIQSSGPRIDPSPISAYKYEEEEEEVHSGYDDVESMG